MTFKINPTGELHLNGRETGELNIQQSLATAVGEDSVAKLMQCKYCKNSIFASLSAEHNCTKKINTLKRLNQELKD